MASRTRILAALLIMAPLVASSEACKHDTIDSGTNSLPLFLVGNPAGAGRFKSNNTPDTAASFQLKIVQFLPVDAQSQSVYGNNLLTLGFNFGTFYMNDPTPQALEVDPGSPQSVPKFTSIGLAVGTYQITSMTITHPHLNDNALPPPPYPTCIDGVSVISFDNNSTLTNPPTFTIQPGQTSLNFKVNVPGFIAGYEAALTCQTGCGPGGSNCVTAINEAAFQAAFLANLTID